VRCTVCRALYGALLGILHGALYGALYGILHGALYGVLYSELHGVLYSLSSLSSLYKFLIYLQVAELQEEIKRRESRWSAANSRYRNRIEALEEQNKELQEEVKLLEKYRLEKWRNDEMKVGL
jgi:hypothetical protein